MKLGCNPHLTHPVLMLDQSSRVEEKYQQVATAHVRDRSIRHKFEDMPLDGVLAFARLSTRQVPRAVSTGLSYIGDGPPDIQKTKTSN